MTETTETSNTLQIVYFLDSRKVLLQQGDQIKILHLSVPTLSMDALSYHVSFPCNTQSAGLLLLPLSMTNTQRKCMHMCAFYKEKWDGNGFHTLIHYKHF